MNPIITGANIYRARQVLTAAQIHALDSTPVLIAAAIPGKIMAAIAVAAKYNFGTQEYDFGSGAGATLYYGPLSSDESVLFGSDLVAVIANQTTSSYWNPFLTNAQSQHQTPVSGTQGEPIYLVASASGFNSGSAAAAVPDPANAYGGRGYAPGDTGVITSGDGTATYDVLTVDANGGVLTLTATGGTTGYTTSPGNATSVTTGAGDGNLLIDVVAALGVVSSGTVTSATGKGYAVNDTGTIPGTFTTPANYTVTSIGAGGTVTGLRVSGGTGVTTGNGLTTTVTTGAGDGLLLVDITAIAALGDGTLEIDVLYQPI